MARAKNPRRDLDRSAAEPRHGRASRSIDVVLGIGFLCSIIVGAVKMAGVMYVAF
jgi:hypothetical protein